MYGPKWPFLLILIVYLPSVVVVHCWDRFCILGRSPRTKETPPDFREWCRVTRYSRLFHGLTGYQRTPREMGRHTLPVITVSSTYTTNRMILELEFPWKTEW